MLRLWNYGAHLNETLYLPYFVIYRHPRVVQGLQNRLDII